MKKLQLLLALGLPAIGLAQSPLSTLTATGSGFLWTGCPSPNLFFNLVVATPITIQGLDVALYEAIGLQGSVEVFVTNPGITTYVGSEAVASAWTLAASGPVTSVGVNQPARVSLTTGITLQPNTYGVAIHYVGVKPIFLGGTGTVAPGGGGPGTNQFFQNTELTLLAGNTQPFAFGAGPQPLPYVWRGAIHYELGAVQHGPASNVKYGSGCYAINGSFHQRFSCASAPATVLNGRSLSMLFTGAGYALTPGPVAYIAPSPAATSLTPQDEGELSVALTNVLNYPGGSTQTLFVHMNGIVSVASNTVPSARWPSVTVMHDLPQTAWFSWHDYNPAEPGSGTIKFEEVGTLAIITWDDVESLPGSAAAPLTNRCTFQFQFDTATGNVSYVWQTITPIGGSNSSDDHIIGFSPGGASPNLGPIDIPTFTGSVLSVPEVLPLALAASPSPVLGATVDYTTSNETGQNIGIVFLTLASLPGIDLGILGAPGCAANVDITTGITGVISNFAPGFTMTMQLPIPAQTPLLGFQLFGQTIWLDPVANPFGILVTNGVKTTLGSF
ncbi:MAG TPA: hypothetical protein VF384_19535 [Planctomycetota bacterium]